MHFEIEALIREAVVEAKNAARAQRLVRIGLMETYAAIHLPAVLRAFSEMDVLPFTGPSAEMADRVRSGVLDFAVISSGVRTPDLDVSSLSSDELHLARGLTLRGADLDRICVIRGIDALLKSQLLEAMTEKYGRTPIIIEVGSLDTIRSAVEGGVACSILPARYLKAICAEGAALAVSEIPRRLVVEVVGIRRKLAGDDNNWRRFVETLRNLA